MRRATGFTIIEVLVSIAILAFGLLGAASLQVSAVRSAHSSDGRSTALYLAYEIVDRIRANRYSCLQATATPVSTAAGFPGDCYDLSSVATGYTNYFNGSLPASNCFGASANCNATAIAYSDIWSWQQRVAALLPGGEAVVCNDSTPADGTPSWAPNAAASTKGASLYQCDGKAVAASACSTCGAVAPVLTVKIFWNDRIAASQTAATSSTTNDQGQTYRRVYMSFAP